MFSSKKVVLTTSLMCLSASGFASTQTPNSAPLNQLHSVVLEDVKSGYPYFDRNDQSSFIRNGMLFYRDVEGGLTAYDVTDKDGANQESLRPKWTFKKGEGDQGNPRTQPLFPAVFAEDTDTDDTVFFIGTTHDVFALDPKTTLMHPEAKWEYHNPDAATLYRMSYPRALDGMLHIFEQEDISRVNRFAIIRKVGDTTEKLGADIPEKHYPQKVIVDARNKILYALLWKRESELEWNPHARLFAFPMGDSAVKAAVDGKIKPLWVVSLSGNATDMVRSDNNAFTFMSSFKDASQDRLFTQFCPLSPTNPAQKPVVLSGNFLKCQWQSVNPGLQDIRVSADFSQMTLINNIAYFWASDSKKKVPAGFSTNHYHNAFYAYDLNTREVRWKYSASSINTIMEGNYKGASERISTNNFAPVILKNGDLMLARTVVDPRKDFNPVSADLTNAYESQVFILDAKTGQEKNRLSQTSDDELPISMMPTVSNDQLLAVGSDMRLRQATLIGANGEAPTVNAGHDVHPLSGTNINFSIGLSGKIKESGDFSYEWRQISGNQKLKLTAPDSLNTRVNIPAGLIEDNFTFELHATDKSGYFKKPGAANVTVTLRAPNVWLVTEQATAGEKISLKAMTNMPWKNENRSTFVWEITDMSGNVVDSGEKTNDQSWDFFPSTPGSYIVNVVLRSYMGRQASWSGLIRAK
ncbi:hypothetical protein ACVBEF_05320 [Glaciimonas sp. GG7]